MNKFIQVLLRVSILAILVFTYLYVTRAKPIKSFNEINICQLDGTLVLESNRSEQYISKVEVIKKSDAVQFIVYRKTISFVQSGPHTYEINLHPGIKIIQIAETTLNIAEIEKCIE